jgi:hypothetical protein
MTDGVPTTAWIFVSHASVDLPAVRRVRNYLEDKDAAPLLFHLKALTEEDEFWPIIAREIAARNFFLYCESPAAAASPWVRRERLAVEAASRTSPRRIGSIRVDGGEIDFRALDAFLTKTRVFPSYLNVDEPIVRPFLDALKAAGLTVYDGPKIGEPSGIRDQAEAELRAAAGQGWVVPFISRGSMANGWVRNELALAEKLGARFAPVLLEEVPELPPFARERALQAYQVSPVDHFSYLDPEGPRRLVDALLSR